SFLSSVNVLIFDIITYLILISCNFVSVSIINKKKKKWGIKTPTLFLINNTVDSLP
ncbi:MAG: hypothetical protein RLZZ196_1732, partial [Bacteroidota bacterium]